jgi:hypothetical protein
VEVATDAMPNEQKDDRAEDGDEQAPEVATSAPIE